MKKPEGSINQKEKKLNKQKYSNISELKNSRNNRKF